jgi:hypothetical protein
MEHAWCRDVARDEAVRAAEDGRTGPLPTLEECIETAFSAGVRDSFRKVEEAWSMIPKSVSASSPVDQENKGDGMRTERVRLEERITLEFSFDHRSNFRPKEWAATFLPGAVCQGISVRVVEEAHFDDLAQVAMERDAAIRERDEIRQSWLRSEESGTRLLAERNAALDAADGLRKRVAEREAASGGGGLTVTEGDCLSTVRDAGGRPMPKGPAPGLVAKQAASGGGEGEPDAWGVVRDGNVESVSHRSFRKDEDRVAEKWGGTVVPLYRAPPQPRGWLTEQEIDAVTDAADTLSLRGCGSERRARILRELLARSTPPEVVLPVADCSWCSDYATVWRECLEAVRSSLAAAGVEVKEVGDE